MNPNPSENIFIVGPPNVYILDAEDNLHLWKDVVEYRSNADHTAFTIETATMHEPIFDIKNIQFEFKMIKTGMDGNFSDKESQSYWFGEYSVKCVKWWPTIGNKENAVTIMYKFVMEN